MTITQTRNASQAHSKSLQNASCNEALGNTANISATGTKTVKKQTMLRHSQKTLKEVNMISKRTGKPHRMRFCQVNRAYGSERITIKLNRDDMRSNASFGGLQNCGCVWGCPVCAPRIAAEKGQFILKSLEWGKQSGQTPVMLALTARHHAGMRLEAFKAQFKAAWKMMTKHRKWRNFILSFGISHWIANREVTYGQNGWHYHMHMLLFIDNKAAAAADALDIQSDMEELWLHCLDACGLDAIEGIALKVSAHGNVGQTYLTKIGLTVSEEDGKLEYEMTGAANKDGRSVWDLLRHSYYGDEKATALYIEFVETMSGENFITSSHGLAALANSVSLESETEAAEQSDSMREWAEISPYWWTVVLLAGAADNVLEVAAISREVSDVRDLVWRLQEQLISFGELPQYHRRFRYEPASSGDFAGGIRLIE